MMTRRDFTAKAAAAVTVATSAKSYSQILGANNRLNFAVIGLNSRAYAHLSALKDNNAHARISHVCDDHMKYWGRARRVKVSSI